MKRNPCYCESIAKEALKSQGVPKGYCGFCEVCEQPGHIQHFPGAAPYTGAWCDSCFLKLKRKQQIKTICIFVVLMIGGYFFVHR